MWNQIRIELNSRTLQFELNRNQLLSELHDIVLKNGHYWGVLEKGHGSVSAAVNVVSLDCRRQVKYRSDDVP